LLRRVYLVVDGHEEVALRGAVGLGLEQVGGREQLDFDGRVVNRPDESGRGQHGVHGVGGEGGRGCKGEEAWETRPKKIGGGVCSPTPTGHQSRAVVW
jgi:hypothetical protein